MNVKLIEKIISLLITLLTILSQLLKKKLAKDGGDSDAGEKEALEASTKLKEATAEQLVAEVGRRVRMYDDDPDLLEFC